MFLDKMFTNLVFVDARPATCVVARRNTGVFRLVAIFLNILGLAFLSTHSVAQVAAETAQNNQTRSQSPVPVLGTLFLTADERRALERARLQRAKPPVLVFPTSASRSADELPIAPREATITGFMQRSDGATTVWINGIEQPNFSQARAQKLQPRNVGMLESTEPDMRKSDPQKPSASNVPIKSNGVVTAGNQTKPLKRRALIAAPPKIAVIDLSPKPSKKKKRKAPVR